MLFNEISNDMNSKESDQKQAVSDFVEYPSTRETLMKMAELVSSFDMGGFKMGCIIKGVTYHITFEKQNPNEDNDD